MDKMAATNRETQCFVSGGKLLEIAKIRIRREGGVVRTRPAGFVRLNTHREHFQKELRVKLPEWDEETEEPVLLPNFDPYLGREPSCAAKGCERRLDVQAAKQDLWLCEEHQRQLEKDWEKKLRKVPGFESYAFLSLMDPDDFEHRYLDLVPDLLEASDALLQKGEVQKSELFHDVAAALMAGKIFINPLGMAVIANIISVMNQVLQSPNLAQIHSILRTLIEFTFNAVGVTLLAGYSFQRPIATGLIGGAMGVIAGAIAGSVVPVFGTILGGVLGGGLAGAAGGLGIGLIVFKDDAKYTVTMKNGQLKIIRI